MASFLCEKIHTIAKLYSNNSTYYLLALFGNDFGLSGGFRVRQNKLLLHIIAIALVDYYLKIFFGNA